MAKLRANSSLFITRTLPASLLGLSPDRSRTACRRGSSVGANLQLYLCRYSRSTEEAGALARKGLVEARRSEHCGRVHWYGMRRSDLMSFDKQIRSWWSLP